MTRAESFAEAAARLPGTVSAVHLAPARTVRFRHWYGENGVQPVEKQLAFDLGAEYVWEMDQSWRCWSEFGFVFTPESTVIRDSFSFPHDVEINNHIRIAKESAVPSTIRHLDGDVFVWTNTGSRNYFHAVSELMPRLLFLDRFPYSRLLVPAGRPAFVNELFELLGVAQSRLVEIDPGTVYTADRLLATNWGLNFIPERYGWLKRRVLRGYAQASPQKRVFIRRNAGNRVIMNAEAVEKVFMDHGFEICDAALLTVAEQSRLFADAAVLAGAHGAGLTNALWMHEPKVLEIRPQGWENRSLYHHALACGAKAYHVLHAKPVDETQSMFVDTKVLERALVQLK
jgi:capsular polysaccharide biosynthesis protein